VSKKRIIFATLGLIAVVYIGVQWNAAPIDECRVMVLGAIGDYRKQHGKWPTTASDIQPFCDSYCLGETRPQIEPIDAKTAILVAEDTSWLWGKVRR
jgi:hypothetical protein